MVIDRAGVLLEEQPERVLVSRAHPGAQTQLHYLPCPVSGREFRLGLELPERNPGHGNPRCSSRAATPAPLNGSTLVDLGFGAPGPSRPATSCCKLAENSLDFAENTQLIMHRSHT